MSFHLYVIKQFISKTYRIVWSTMKLPGLKLAMYYDISFSTVKWYDDLFTTRYILVLKAKSNQHSYIMKQT